MIDILFELFERLKTGANYKKMITKANKKYCNNDSGNPKSIKVKYFAQSTFHTIK